RRVSRKRPKISSRPRYSRATRTVPGTRQTASSAITSKSTRGSPPRKASKTRRMSSSAVSAGLRSRRLPRRRRLCRWLRSGGRGRRWRTRTHSTAAAPGGRGRGPGGKTRFPPRLALEGSHGEPVALELGVVQLGHLALAGPDDRLAGVVDPVRHLHAAV